MFLCTLACNLAFGMATEIPKYELLLSATLMVCTCCITTDHTIILNIIPII